MAAWHERTAEILKIIEAFSKASEYWAVGLCVKASNLSRQQLVSEALVPVGVLGKHSLPGERDSYVLLIDGEA